MLRPPAMAASSSPGHHADPNFDDHLFAGPPQTVVSTDSAAMTLAPQGGTLLAPARVDPVGSRPATHRLASVDGIVQRPFDPHSGELQLAGQPILIGSATTDHNGFVRIQVELPPTLSIVGSVAVQGLILGDRIETTNAHQLR